MRRAWFIFFLFGLGLPVQGQAESMPSVVSSSTTTPETLPSLSSAPASVLVSTVPPSVALIGESVSAPAPRAMTDAPRPLFISALTRTGIPEDRLPTHADVIFPHIPHAYGAENAGEAVARQVGVQVAPQGFPSHPLQVRLRGASANGTLVLVDGRPMTGFSLGPADLSEIPLEQIDHIEIVRGGMSSLYGPTPVGGVINIVSKRSIYQGLPMSHVSYENQSYSRQIYRLDFGSRLGPVDFFFFGDNQWESGFRDHSDWREHNIGGNAGLSLGAGGKLLFDVSSFNRQRGAPGPRCELRDPFCQNGTPFLQPSRFNNKDEKIASTPSAREETDSNAIRASYLLPLPQDSQLTLRAFGTQREVDFGTDADTHTFNINHTERHEQSKGAEAQLQLPLGLLVGGTFVRDREDLTDVLVSTNSFISAVENWGIFIQETLRWENITLIPSGRYDRNSRFGESSNPRVNGMVDATPWLRFSGSAARSFRVPSLDELFFKGLFFNGRSDLRPEKAWTYDAGFELHDSSASFRATYFRANVSDLIQVTPVSGASVQNIGRARRQGAEFQIDQVVNERFRHALNYTVLENLGIPAGYDHYVPLALSPRHTANYVATFRPSKKWTMDSTLRYEGARFSGNDELNAPGSLKMASQLIGDLRVAYQLRQMELYIGVNNVTNKRYVEQPGYPLPGSVFYGGLRLRLWG